MESADIFDGGGVEIFQRADAGTAIGVHAEGRLVEIHAQQLAVRVGEVGLAQLLLHHIALRLEVGFIDDKRAHALGLAPEHTLEVIGGDGFEVVREVVPGGRIVEAAGVFGQAIEAFGRKIGGGFEHQVFEQVGEA